ncbi:hypothetical protein DPMN_011698 [Dreissena polymorpha]|uniref:Uncharacterized protein n=1 Tax=Dreissena polymorpha TaxID=45954 RepID=A0A9D4N4L1_DREPO|nr:hypothetical protein DPMN_011698 [Dreissena polymorpha]
MVVNAYAQSVVPEKPVKFAQSNQGQQASTFITDAVSVPRPDVMTNQNLKQTPLLLVGTMDGELTSALAPGRVTLPSPMYRYVPENGEKASQKPLL